jgi:hypothetical protein
MKSKYFVITFVLVVLAVMSFSLSLADEWYESSEPDIREMTVYVNDEAVWYGSCFLNASLWVCQTYQYAPVGIERSTTIDVKVSFVANSDLEEVSLHSWISGYSDDIEADTSNSMFSQITCIQKN